MKWPFFSQQSFFGSLNTNFFPAYTKIAILLPFSNQGFYHHFLSGFVGTIVGQEEAWTRHRHFVAILKMRMIQDGCL